MTAGQVENTESIEVKMMSFVAGKLMVIIIDSVHGAVKMTV